jgi:hypothetical protein
MSSARRIGRSVALAGALALIFGKSTTAFAMPSCLSRSNVLASSQNGWEAPLDRIISVSVADVTLRDAIDLVASESKLQLSYSADLLPVGKRVCLSVDRMSAGSVLTELLRDTMLRAIVLDTNNVALTPVRGPVVSDRTPAVMTAVGQLDRVVVTGTADGAKSRSSPFALDVLEGRRLAEHNSSTLSSAFDGAVPGLWMWAQSPANMVSRFGSVRGASSFGVTSPKMYIDGIEVANPLVFTQFDADRIDRVEVIRGPQGAALYGADAISGVVNIITRHDGLENGESPWIARSRGGMSSSAFSNGAFVQDHSLGYRAGTGRRSIGLGLGVGTVGNFIPGGSARSLLADGDVRFVGSRTLFTGMARFAAKNSGALTSPLLAGIGTTSYQSAQTSRDRPMAVLDSAAMGETAFGKPGARADSVRIKQNDALYRNSGVNPNATQSLVEYTVGTTGTYTASPRWTHTMVAGVDGYRMNGVSSQGITVAVPTDSLDRLAHTEADRTTLALRSIARMGNEAGFATSIIVGAEHTATRQEIQAHDDVEGGDLSLNAKSPEQSVSFWSNTAGLLSQVNTSWRNALYLSAGGRAEYSAGATELSRVSLLPMLGAAYVREKDGITLKLRTAYGKGIRPSNSVARAATWMSTEASAYAARGRSTLLELASLRNLEPEAQAGTELGADLMFGGALGVHVTRFDQRATGLIQAVALPFQARIGSAANSQSVTYELQNVGAITNRGWELQGTSQLGRFALQGSASFVDSRVAQVANKYSGELRVGDRMLEVPAETFGFSGTYTAPRWSGSLGISRAMNWINYDQLAIAERQSESGFYPRSVTGAYLRDFWREYQGVNRVRSTFSYSLTHGLALIVTGDNLLNLQRGEPDNVTVVPGRTLTLGIRTRF